MNEEHFISSYQAWDENRLNPEERRVIQRHLAECKSCSDYFEKMSALLGTADPSLLPRLEADPFLPTRIRAIVDAGEPAMGEDRSAAAREPVTVAGAPVAARERMASYGRAAGWLRISLAGAMTVVAMAAGVYLGKGLATTLMANGDTEIVTAYYEAVAQNGFAGDWGDVIEEEEEQR